MTSKPPAPAAKRAKAASAKTAATSKGTAAAMLESGMKALAQARHRAESGPAKVVANLIDPFGFRKLEDVFDQRVASALDRLGLPAPEVLIALVQELEELRARVAVLEKARR